MGEILRSDWGSLSEFLQAKLYPVERAGDSTRWRPVRDAAQIWAPITDSNLETTLQWNSPFEAIGAANKLPLISGLLQSGGLQSALSAIASIVPDEVGNSLQDLNSSLSKQSASATLRSLENSAGITKLNSTQIFSGMQPLKFTMTMHFRAWSDPAVEVSKPIDELMRWLLPQELANIGFLESLASGQNLVRALFPSKIPRILGFSYGGMSILPVVVESIGQPITAPRDALGRRVQVALPMVVATLAAIDQQDWTKYGVR